MPAITLYGNDLSPPSRSVRMAAEAVGVDVDLKRTYPMAGECRKDQYLKTNPMHTIPTMIDNGFILSDSHAIMIYLVEKYGKNDSLYPKDIKKRSIVNERLFFDIALWERILTFTGPPLIFKKEPNDEAKDRVIDGLEVTDRFLSKTKFIAGDNVTIADFCYLGSVTFLEVIEKCKVDLSKYTNIQRWLNLVLETDPLFKKYDDVYRKSIKTFEAGGSY